MCLILDIQYRMWAVHIICILSHLIYFKYQYTTGKKPLRQDIYNLNTNIRVIKGRPKLDSVIPNIIYGIESKEGMPEKFTQSAKEQRAATLNRAVSTVNEFHPWKENQSQEKCVKRFGDSVMQTWGIMYCGGSPPVIASLQGLSLKYHIDVHIDSFAW